MCSGRPSVKLPFKMVWNVLLFLKWIHEKFGFSRYNHSTWARYIQLATCTRTFNCVAAHKQLGYSPIVSMEVSCNENIYQFLFHSIFLFKLFSGKLSPVFLTCLCLLSYL